MPRIARVVSAGLPHHITQRGNYRQDIFVDDNDRVCYLSWLQEYSQKFGLCIFTYCLMQNHVHFIAAPTQRDSLAKTFHATHMRYSQYFNKKLNATGHLWQGRFYSCILDEPHLLLAAKYIERNPVRAKMVHKPWQWQWSSALAHTSRVANSPLDSANFLNLVGMTSESWRDYIDRRDESRNLDEIRKHTFTGRPLGTISFIGSLEKKLGRRLHALSVGRPRKKK